MLMFNLTKGDVELKTSDVLKAQLSQIRIIHNPSIKTFDNNQIYPGTLVSFSVLQIGFQNAGHIEQGGVNLTGMSPIKGDMAIVQGIPITMETNWAIYDENGKLAVENIDYILLNGNNKSTIDLIFVPRIFSELTSKSMDPSNDSRKTYQIKASITVNLGDQLEKGDVPEIEIKVLPLFVPIVSAFFNNTDFLNITNNPRLGNGDLVGDALIVVPVNSLIRNYQDLLKELKYLEQISLTLISIPTFSKLCITIKLVSSALRNFENPTFRINSNLHFIHIDYPHRPNKWINNISSLFLLGPPGSSITCYVEKERPAEGIFTLKTEITKNTCFALVRNLENEEPPTEPSNSQFEIEEPLPRGGSFNNNLSYVKFNELPLTPVIL
jgi:hypothetical protein